MAEGNIPETAFSQPTVFLGLDQKRPEDIIQVIQGLLSVDEDGEQNTFPTLDDISKLILMSHSLAAYCGGLEKHISQKLSARFTADTTRWLSQLFGWVF